MDKFKIKCVRGEESWFAYLGVSFEKEKAECEAKGISRQWPDIKTELVPDDGKETNG